MGWSRWSNDSGYETAYLVVLEVGDDGRIVYHGRFDEDDFENAYRELERRYYAGEGARVCEFELDDEAAAFVYAEERMRAADSASAATTGE